MIFVSPGKPKSGGVRQNDAPYVDGAGCQKRSARNAHRCWRRHPGLDRRAGDLWQRELESEGNVGRRSGLSDGSQLGLDAAVFFSESDVDSKAKVCVIGQTLIPKLFRTTQPDRRNDPRQ